ncbi:hypothetical protein BGX21_007889, partial [Mortierella sp. AD011]
RKGAVIRNLEDYDPNAPLPSYETVDGYVKAITALYQDQKSNPAMPEMQHQEHPRSPGVRALMEAYLLRISKLKKVTDVASLTLDQGYEIQTLKEVMRKGWTH